MPAFVRAALWPRRAPGSAAVAAPGGQGRVLRRTLAAEAAEVQEFLPPPLLFPSLLDRIPDHASRGSRFLPPSSGHDRVAGLHSSALTLTLIGLDQIWWNGAWWAGSSVSGTA